MQAKVLQFENYPMRFISAISWILAPTALVGARQPHQQQEPAKAPSCDRIFHVSNALLAIADDAVNTLVGPLPPLDERAEESTCHVAQGNLVGKNHFQLPQASEHYHDTIKNVIDGLDECKETFFDANCLDAFESTAVHELRALISVYATDTGNPTSTSPQRHPYRRKPTRAASAGKFYFVTSCAEAPATS